jgi:hypothetical protein
VISIIKSVGSVTGWYQPAILEKTLAVGLVGNGCCKDDTRIGRTSKEMVGVAVLLERKLDDFSQSSVVGNSNGRTTGRLFLVTTLISMK